MALPRKSMRSGYSPGDTTTQSKSRAALMAAWIDGYSCGTYRPWATWTVGVGDGAVAVAVSAEVAVKVGVKLGVTLGVFDLVIVGEGVRVGVRLRVIEGVGVGRVPVGVIDGVTTGVWVNVTVGLGVRVQVGAEIVASGVPVA
jgi:hypothetical protein